MEVPERCSGSGGVIRVKMKEKRKVRRAFKRDVETQRRRGYRRTRLA